jgi:tRNA(fMet)-specific endonuclease VapC
MFCLDTNVIIGVMTRRAPRLDDRLRAELLHGSRLFVPAPVLVELRYGAAKSAAPERNHARLDDFLSAVPEVAAFDTDDAAEAGDIRAYLERRGKPIGPYDVLIAAQARRRGAVLVTLNRREFERVPGLMVTDWNDR